MTETASPRQNARRRRRQQKRSDTAIRQARRVRAAAEARMLRDFRPPEGVILGFRVASVGARFGAQLLDLLLTGLALIATMIVLLVTEILPWSAFVTLAYLYVFAIRSPYYIATELLWNGQTLGKRITGLRVVSADGRSLRPYAVVVRNLMKEMEIFVPGTMLLASSDLSTTMVILLLFWLAILLAVPLMNKKRQRLGDIVAGTYVIEQPKAVLADDVAVQVAATETEEFRFLNHQLDHYGRFELQTLEKILQIDDSAFKGSMKTRHDQNISAIAQKIVAKIEYTGARSSQDHKAFLKAFYRAQRQYLETRQLFGDAREDKFHKEDGEG